MQAKIALYCLDKIACFRLFLWYVSISVLSLNPDYYRFDALVSLAFFHKLFAHRCVLAK